jgi:hypothetical protein
VGGAIGERDTIDAVHGGRKRCAFGGPRKKVVVMMMIVMMIVMMRMMMVVVVVVVVHDSAGVGQGTVVDP